MLHSTYLNSDIFLPLKVKMIILFLLPLKFVWPTFRALRRISPPDPPEHILELSVCAEALIDASEERLNIVLS